MANSANAGREPQHAAAPVSAAGTGSAGRKRPRDTTADLLGKCEGRFLAADVPALAQLVRSLWGGQCDCLVRRGWASFVHEQLLQCS